MQYTRPKSKNSDECHMSYAVQQTSERESCWTINYLRNEFHFSGVHGAMNRSGSRAK